MKVHTLGVREYNEKNTAANFRQEKDDILKSSKSKKRLSKLLQTMKQRCAVPMKMKRELLVLLTFSINPKGCEDVSE